MRGDIRRACPCWMSISQQGETISQVYELKIEYYEINFHYVFNHDNPNRSSICTCQLRCHYVCDILTWFDYKFVQSIFILTNTFKYSPNIINGFNCQYVPVKPIKVMQEL